MAPITGQSAGASRSAFAYGGEPDRRAGARNAGANAGSGSGSSGGKSTFPFRAELDLAELDGRHRPGQPWSARGVDLSRSALTFKSRRMCYEGRELVVAVHLVDDRPVPLFGVVAKSEYEGEGLYRTVLSLQEMPDNEFVKGWVDTLWHRGNER